MMGAAKIGASFAKAFVSSCSMVGSTSSPALDSEETEPEDPEEVEAMDMVRSCLLHRRKELTAVAFIKIVLSKHKSSWCSLARRVASKAKASKSCSSRLHVSQVCPPVSAGE